MRQGITTRYIGPSNVKGSRIKATARKADRARGWKEMSHTRSYQYRSSQEEHTLAAQELATKLGWHGLWIGGGKPEEDGYHYVNTGQGLWDNATLEPYKVLGKEGEDWFYVSPQEPRV